MSLTDEVVQKLVYPLVLRLRTISDDKSSVTSNHLLRSLCSQTSWL